MINRDPVGGEWSLPVLITPMGGGYGDWTPDGDQIVFSHEGSIWRMTLAGELWRLYRALRGGANPDGIVESSLVRLSTDVLSPHIGAGHARDRRAIG